MNKYQKLLEPAVIGTVRTRNRLLKTGSSPGFYPWEDGYVQQKAIDVYESLAKGGVGIVTVGAAPLGVPPGQGYVFNDDKYVPRMTELTDAIHRYGCPVFMQTFHLGPMLPPFMVNVGAPALAASTFTRETIPLPHLGIPKELTVPEIEGIVADFVDQMVRMKKAGFDGVELNAGCTHLFNSFISRGWNKREDEYGAGSLESRAKIVVDIIKEIKRINGKDFAVIALINGAEPGLDNGMNHEEAQGIAKLLEAAGADAIHVRVEFYSRPKDPSKRDSTQFPDIAFYPETPFPLNGEVDDSRHGAGGWVPPAVAVKKVVSVPVIAVGRLDPDLGEDLLRKGEVDFISFNRRLMADPELPNKLAEGHPEDIRPCTGCCTCFDNNEKGNPPLCQINASWGKEKEYEIKPAEQKKKVMVIGSGPAGMEAALVAAARGHEVVLFEKQYRLGGSLPLAAMVKGFEREDTLGLIRYYETQLGKSSIDVRLGTEADEAVIKEIKPDALIIAAGGAHNIPELPGIDGKNVVTSAALHQRLKKYLRYFGPKLLRWLTNFWMPLGKNVVIMGGNIQGYQTAYFLVKRGRTVTIVESSDTIGDGLLEMFVKPHLLSWLEEKGMTMLTGATYEKITPKGLVIKTKDGKKMTVLGDTVVTALPLKPNTGLSKALKGLAPKVYVIGDCHEPKLIVDAIADGARIGRLV